MPGLVVVLDQTRAALQAAPVTLQTLPPEITRDWLAPDGRARLSVIPRGDSNNNAVLERFIAQVTAVAPNATGTPIGIQGGGKVVSGAFLEAGVLSFIAITLLLFAVLRRARDVAITMAPIVLTGPPDPGHLRRSSASRSTSPTSSPCRCCSASASPSTSISSWPGAPAARTSCSRA